MKAHYDFIVVGSGLAGLAFALKAKELGTVAVLSKTKLETGNTEMAQGGIAAVMSPEDSLEQHLADTQTAGAGLCNSDVVRQIIEQGPDRIEDLIGWGVKFDLNKNAENFSLTKEGGHSQRRILHVEDHTGLDIQRQLLAQVRNEENIDLIENCLAVDVITNWTVNPNETAPKKAVGLYYMSTISHKVSSVLADKIILATGGAGKTYLYTSNWSGATGDGVAMAYRAGARVSNLEFMQFHPTCLYHPHSRNFLITEAMRGEGAELINSNGEAFMKDHHPLGSLAPRDIVARSIDAEMKKTGAESVFLDITHKDPMFIAQRFPRIFSKCLELGIDIRTEPIPVVPAAHYLCGGVLTDIAGQTDIQNLHAIGETACTGLHGANRLASNSLLECLAMAHSAAEQMAKSERQDNSKHSVPAWPQKNTGDDDELILVSHMWDEIRRLMWAYVGIVRTNRRLRRAQNRIQNLLNEFSDYYAEFAPHPDIIELRNIALVADLTIKCALQRKESVGIHFNLDYQPDVKIKPNPTIINPVELNF